MKSIKSSALLVALTTLLLGVTNVLQAQDPDTEARNAFNSGLEAAQAKNFDQAIAHFENALKIAEENGLDEIKEKSENQLPKIYSSRASAAYSGYQSNKSVASLNNAIEKFEEANEAANKYGDDQIAQRTRAAIPQLYYIRGVVQYSQGDYADANESLNTAINMNSNYAVAYYQKALVSKKENRANTEQYLQWIDRAIQVAEQNGDNALINKASENAEDELIYQGVQQADQKRYDAAINLVNQALEYNPSSADAHYRLAEIYNKRSNWSRAIEHARKALEFESGGVVDKAKIYFELGTAYQGNGQKNQACGAFEDAAHGEFKDPSLHKMEHELKCEGYASAGSR